MPKLIGQSLQLIHKYLLDFLLLSLSLVLVNMSLYLFATQTFLSYSSVLIDDRAYSCSDHDSVTFGIKCRSCDSSGVPRR